MKLIRFYHGRVAGGGPVNSGVRRLSFEENMAIESSPRIVSTTVLGLGTAVIMRGKKILVIIIALALLLACIVALRLRREKAVGRVCRKTSRLIRRPGLRGSGRDACLQFRPRTLGDPWRHLGVTIVDRGSIRQVLVPSRQDSTDHIELSADGGWDLLIGTDGEDGPLKEHTLAFPVKLGGRPLKFNCDRRSDRWLSSHHRGAPGSDELEGELPTGSRHLQECLSRKNLPVALPTAQDRGNFAKLKKQG